jgi:hypothetical protein
MMKRTLTSLSGAALLLAVMSCVHAQVQEAAPATAQPAPGDQPLEPAVDTSKAKDPGESQATPAAEAPKEESGASSTAPAPAQQPGAPAPSQDRSGRFKTVDRLELESSAVTGNRELPKVLYIVPWKKADLGDLVGRPASSLLDEVLSPVDRDVFRRQTDYFSTLEQGAAGSEQPPEGQASPQSSQPSSPPPSK